MTYEVVHGERTHFISCSNPHQACMVAIKREACDDINDDVILSPFSVTNLDTGHVDEIDMETIVSLRVLANANETQEEQNKA